jgi:hypothetical protein
MESSSNKKGEIKMKRTIVSVSLAMLMCFGFMGEYRLLLPRKEIGKKYGKFFK